MRIHPHAADRMAMRGASDDEVFATLRSGERFPAKHGRTGFRRNFPGPFSWRDRMFDTKQLEVYAVFENDEWLAITVIVKYF